MIQIKRINNPKELLRQPLTEFAQFELDNGDKTAFKRSRLIDVLMRDGEMLAAVGLVQRSLMQNKLIWMLLYERFEDRAVSNVLLLKQLLKPYVQQHGPFDCFVRSKAYEAKRLANILGFQLVMDNIPYANMMFDVYRIEK